MGTEKEIAVNPAMWGFSDLAEYQAKMRKGIENLADIQSYEIAIGETLKDEVFSVEKVSVFYALLTFLLLLSRGLCT